MNYLFCNLEKNTFKDFESFELRRLVRIIVEMEETVKRQKENTNVYCSLVMVCLSS